MKKYPIKLPKVFKRDPLDDILSYQKWFHSVKNYIKWHCTDLEMDIGKISRSGGLMDRKAGTWYNAKAEYMNKYFKVDE
jgi:hypothetical protein